MKIIHHRGRKRETHEDIANVSYGLDGFLVAKSNDEIETRFTTGTVEVERHDGSRVTLPAKRKGG